MLAVPLKLLLGRKRILLADAAVKTVAELSDTAPKAVQVVPPSVEYSQVPLLVSVPVTAIPPTAPVSASVMLLPIISETEVPWLPTSFWLIVARVELPELSSTGASLTAVTLTVLVSALLTPPS